MLSRRRILSGFLSTLPGHFGSVLDRRIIYTTLLILTVTLSIATSVNEAHAQGSELLTAEEAMAIVDGEERLEEQLLEAQPADAELIYVRSGGEFIPRYWLVLLTDAESRPLGVVGIDPYNGELGIEHFVDETYRFPQYDPNRTQDLLAANDIPPEDYSLEEARLIWLGGKVKANLWFIPHGSGELADALALTAFDRLGKLYEYMPIEPLFTTEQGESMYSFAVLSDYAAQTDWALGEGAEFEEVPPEDVSPPPEGTEASADQATSTQSVDASNDSGVTGRRITDQASGSNNGEYWDTDLVPDVPFYQQGSTRWCALFALSMLHQWWSPTQINSGRGQSRELANFLNHNTSQGTTVSEMKGIITQWDVIDGNYQDFQTTYVGVGRHPIQDRGPSYLTDDIKSWITLLDAPVAAITDSDGNGSSASTDHVVLVTGYDDRKEKIWINNSGANLGKSGGGAEGTVSYSDWNNMYWSAKWQTNPDRRYGIVGGYPGDMQRASISAHDGQVLGLPTREDDERIQVDNISLTVGNDGAKEGSDPFGESYETTVRLDFLQSDGYFEDETLGDFDSAGAPTFTFYHNSGLNQGDTLSGADVYIDPAEPNLAGFLGPAELQFKYTIYDREDRYHYYGSEILVRDDRGKGTGNNTLRMPRPSLDRDVIRFTESYTVTDDDPSGPLITNFQPTPGTTIPDDEWPSGDLGLQADVVDSSGIHDVTFHVSIYDLPSNTLVYTNAISLTPHGTGTYHYAVPRDKWYNHDKVEWWLEATDDDQDRPVDRAHRTSTLIPLYLTDDDTEGPSVTDHDGKGELVTISQQEKVKYTLKVKLSDPEGVLDDGTYPTIYYRWGNQEVTDSLNDGSIDADWDGTWYTATFTAPLDRRDETLYWRVLSRDEDSDRSASIDQATSWSQTFQADVPARLCVNPASIDHDFGMLSNVSGGTTTAQWPFTVENCGGSSLTVSGGVERDLQSLTGSTPQCPHGPGHCWLGVSGIPSGGQRLWGGQQQTVTVKINALGFDYQVPPLTPGEYEGQLRFDSQTASGTTTLTGTVRTAIPQITVAAPQKGIAWEKGETVTVTWQSAYMPAGANVTVELSGPSSQVLASSVPNSGSFTWTVPTSGIQDGQYRVAVSPAGLPTMAGQSEPFWIGNAPPNQPTNQSPSDGAQGISSTPTLTSSPFADPNTGDVHLASQWQLRSDTFGTDQYNSPLWDSMTDTLNLQSTTVPSGTLPPMADAETTITVEVGDDYFAPDHFNVTRGQTVSLTVKNVGTKSHSLYIPELETSTPTIPAGGTATVTFTPRRAGEFSFHCTVSNHRELGQVGTVEVDESTYWWRVRHQDDSGTWSPWSTETRFSIVYSPPVSLPAGVLNFQNVLADFSKFDDLTITYDPLGPGDLNLGGANMRSAERAAVDDPLLHYAGVAFDLVARDQDGELVTQFDDFYTLTISYEDWQWQNAGIGSEQTLNLYWNTDQGWEPILPCDGCSHNLEDNVIVARLDHLTRFALLGRAPAYRAYIPLIVR